MGFCLSCYKGEHEVSVLQCGELLFEALSTLEMTQDSLSDFSS